MTDKYQISIKYIVLAVVLVLGGCTLLSGQRVDREQTVDPWRPSEEQLAQVTPVEDRKFETIRVGERELKVEVVDTQERITTGLSYREEIGADGMLFVLPRRGVPSFWMKGMLMSLDFVWIGDEASSSAEPVDESGLQVVDIIENVEPPASPDDREQLKIYQPLVPVTHVLEVPAGWVEQSGVQVGEEVKL